MPRAATSVLGHIGPTKQRVPVWAGPTDAGSRGGISQSLISRYLACRERFRVKVIEGLAASESFSAPLEYGNLWHAAEEAHAGRIKGVNSTDWSAAVEAYAEKLSHKHPFQREQVSHWYSMCVAQFPVYVDWWARHPDMERRSPLLAEKVFHVSYQLPSGRVVYLRGKWDSVDLVEYLVWIQENKTKSSIDAPKLQRMLRFDIQSLTYIVAFEHADLAQLGLSEKTMRGKPGVHGVRYNVIRRSAHKSPESMLKKMTEDIADGRGGEWFARWNVEVSEDDVRRFRRECLDPVLENLCDDYEWWAWLKVPQGLGVLQDAYNSDLRAEVFPTHISRHYRLPYGVWNTVAEGNIGEVDLYLETGSTAGLKRVDELFPELAE